MPSNYTLVENEFLGIPVLEVNYKIDRTKLEPQIDPIKSLVVHHTGSQDYTLDKLIEFSMGKLELGAIGYHFVIDEEGKLYYVRNLSWKGAHAYPNTGKIGIGFLRSFDYKQPTTKEIDTFRIISSLLCNKFNIPILGHNQDQLLELYRKYDLSSASTEVITELSFPTSTHEFNHAKQTFQSVYDNPSFRREVMRLKTCPGVNFYNSEAMYHE